MPFTISHAAAVLPFAGRAGFVTSALMVGSVAPDVPYYLQLGSESGLTHSALGVVTIDLVMGLALLALWTWWFAPAAWLLAPERARTAWPAGWGSGAGDGRWWRWSALSIVIGSATHVVWDSFTHEGRWGVELVPWLADSHAGLEGYRWAQYASGAIGRSAVRSC